MHRSLLVWAALAALASPAPAAPGRLDEFDRRIVAELEQGHPDAAIVFRQANEARDRGDDRTAAGLYAQVREMAPGFVHATRRQAGSELASGNRPKALALGREALTVDPSPENMASLALSLARAVPPSKPSTAELDEALRLAEKAALLAPDDFHVQGVLAQVALVEGDLVRLRKGVDRLLVVGADEEATYVFKALLDASEGRFDDAEASLERARGLGMTTERHAALRDAIRSGRSPMQRLASAGAWVGGVWLGAFLVLLGAGFWLSRAALVAASRMPDEPSGPAAGASGWLSRTYAVVLWLCCAYYYVSLPLVLAVVVLAGGGLIFACFAIGHIPVKLVVIVALLVLMTVWSMLKSLFVRGKDQDPDPGVRLVLGSHPRLDTLLQEVAAAIGTAPVASVYLTPGTDIAVMERGGLLRQLRGAGERCLILGVGVLDGLRIGPFKAVLAHEYGHFSNRDTAGGGFALGVRRSLVTMAVNLAQSGAAAWYNPAWLFLNGFYRVFLRISQGASRLQETLADRWAAFTYGAPCFEQGLRHVIERSVRFNAHADATLKEILERQQPLLNLYAHQPMAVPEEAALQKAVEEAMNATPSPYDSHPAPAERLRWIRRFAARSAPPVAADEGEVWDLFEDRTRIERRLTGQVRASVLRAHGIRIAGRAESPSPGAGS